MEGPIHRIEGGNPKPQGHSSSVLRTPPPKEDICVPFDLVRNLAHLEPINPAYLVGADESIWLTGDGDQPTFVAFCAPEQMTEGTWNLYLIAVYVDLQSKGYGRQVMAYLENLLSQQSARVLLVETSGLPEFERTRSFYHQCDYTEEARIRDFYKAGEDKVVFWKSL